MKLILLGFSKQDEDDEPIKDTFKVGDIIVCLFKARVKIKKSY